jgi:hypothetical protein
MVFWLKRVVIAAMMSFMVIFAACESEGPAEQAGEELDEAAEEVEDEVEEAGEHLEESAEDVKDKME